MVLVDIVEVQGKQGYFKPIKKGRTRKSDAAFLVGQFSLIKATGASLQAMVCMERRTPWAKEAQVSSFP